ncbi:hypothetical protein CGRA01v4_07750 [Colletotrichum graminicola]|uniref:RING-type domain-containing protein n=1 Tax=Colletotrichum graminicola (strain M1.001 / M2 / FGSC 10212) TaxID=645133 RepID=E3QPP8_COLGM|nr:uncharacterized protein GLRG_07969 [Colletotrichum graminicola M1.001]EFQ32825.1 hypothetical protein GLRG_07969 [Colletotrichum graminicola M1.001]WDK16467.1 hypothetical protein CGRA01v4_07750 [Colletotrichum graminicola]
MPSNNTKRSAVRCHPMSTRSTAAWRETSSSSDSDSSENSVPDSSPNTSPARVSDMPNPSRKRRRGASGSEEPEASSSVTRPMKKLKVSGGRASSPVDSEDAEGSLPVRRPMKKLRISKRHSPPTDIDSDDDADETVSPSEPADELDGGDSAPNTPSPALHVRSDGFWPTIRNDYLRSLEDESIRVDIPCVICGDDCLVDGHLRWQLRRPEGVGREVPAILCCGHMIGDECLEKWRRTRREEGEPPSCPICRMPLQCSDCGVAMPGWPLTRDIPVGGTRTLQQGGHRVTRCNACEAEVILGDGMRLSYYAEGARPDESLLLKAWFDAVRNRVAAEVRAGRHGHVASVDVTDLVLSETFEAMMRRLDDFEEGVHGRVEETLDLMERDLDLRLPWNHPVPSEDEEEEEGDNDYDLWPGTVFRWSP